MKQDRIISKAKQRGADKYVKRTMKFGIELPMMAKEAMEIDKSNGTTLWDNAIDKEMSSVQVAFGVSEKGGTPPPGH